MQKQEKENQTDNSSVIKFRVWLIKEKKLVYLMCSNITIDWTGIIQSVSVDGIDYPEIGDRVFQKEEFILMLFTGLYDSKEEEIYEGDVIKTHALLVNPTKEKGILEKLIKKLEIEDRDIKWDNQTWEVKYLAGAFGLWKPNPICLSLGHFVKKQLEKIGNIYENPKLLSTNK